MYGWNEDNMMAWQTDFFVILCHFLPFDPPNKPKNQKFEKIKNPIILHLSTTNDNHMMYGSWDMECNKQNVLSFWTIFCPTNPLKWRFWKNDKKAQRYHFTHEYHKWQSYHIWFLRPSEITCIVTTKHTTYT